MEDLENSEHHKDSFNTGEIRQGENNQNDGSSGFDINAFDDEALMEQPHDLFSENSHNEFNE